MSTHDIVAAAQDREANHDIRAFNASGDQVPAQQHPQLHTGFAGMLLIAGKSPCGCRPGQPSVRIGSAAKVYAKHVLNYYRVSSCNLLYPMTSPEASGGSA